MKKIKVSLGSKSYPIFLGAGIVSSKVSVWSSMVRSQKAVVIADGRLKAQLKDLTQTLKSAGYKVFVFKVTANESLKDIGPVYSLYGKLLTVGADRDSVIFALGGGVVGDVAGFIAGTYLRGVRWVGVPTTLLAQVDSSIGGKTGINHPAGKNLIGVIYQPTLVLCDLNYLCTLPVREYVSGLGEIIKYGLVFDPPLFSYVEKNWKKVLQGVPDVLEFCVDRCAGLKSEVIARDEFDRLGFREVLNFGHTLGHALEKATAYRNFRHGEAVIWGMRVAVSLSAYLGSLSHTDEMRIQKLLKKIPIPPVPRVARNKKILTLLRFDKKMKDGQLRFVLLSRIGKAFSKVGVEEEKIKLAINSLWEGGQ